MATNLLAVLKAGGPVLVAVTIYLVAIYITIFVHYGWMYVCASWIIFVTGALISAIQTKQISNLGVYLRSFLVLYSPLVPIVIIRYYFGH